MGSDKLFLLSGTSMGRVSGSERRAGIWIGLVNTRRSGHDAVFQGVGSNSSCSQFQLFCFKKRFLRYLTEE